MQDNFKNTPVVLERKALQTAYRMGYERFQDIDTDDLDSLEEFDLAPFTDSAEYANHVLPNLRALAGFDDSGYGTYQENCQIVVVNESDFDGFTDWLCKGQLTESHYLFDDLVDEWHNGAYDSVRNQVEASA